MMQFFGMKAFSVGNGNGVKAIGCPAENPTQPLLPIQT
jgi:hypothetical protein